MANVIKAFFVDKQNIHRSQKARDVSLWIKVAAKFPKMFVNNSSHYEMTLVDILKAQI